MKSFIAVATLLAPVAADAQTWADARTTPLLRQIVAVDATGEPGWPFGAEDVAGDGLGTFQQQEANVDIRSAYAVADADDLWTRLYVSDTANVGGAMVAFIFIDADADAGTGGGADATEIRPEFTLDPSDGGYEYAVGVRGNETVVGAWEWSGAAWQPITNPAPDAFVTVESGSDRDPLLLGADVHGYLQAQVQHLVTGLDESCDAILFFRTWNEPSDYGDVDVGDSAPCVSVDADDDRVLDLLEDLPCDTDADCPGGGECVNGECLPGNPCEADRDCLADETCRDGSCVPSGGGGCASDAECGDLVCRGGQCEPCTPPGDPCDSERICAPTGECVPESEVGDFDDGFSLVGGEVQGGACMCRTGGRPAGPAVLVVFLSTLPLLLRRRR